MKGILVNGPELCVIRTEKGFLIERADGKPMTGDEAKAIVEALFKKLRAAATPASQSAIAALPADGETK